MIFGTIGQIKNALIPYVKTGTMNRRYGGGFGYSWQAQLYGVGGLILAILLDLMWPPHLQKNVREHSELETDDDKICMQRYNRLLHRNQLQMLERWHPYW